MKNFLILFCVFSLLSCSNENTTTKASLEQNYKSNLVIPPIEDATDQMFFEYVTSPVYLEIDVLINDFNDKLNFHGLESDIDSNVKLLNWIDNNISQTQFVDFGEAQAKWQQIKTLQIQECLEFPDVFTFMTSNPVTITEGYYHKWFALSSDPPKVITTPCDKAFDDCTKTATNLYGSRATGHILSGNSEALADAKAVKDRALEKCRENYIGCVGK